MKNPWPNQLPKFNMSPFVPPGHSSVNPERVVRAPGEFSSDPVLREWQMVELQLSRDEKIILQELSALSEQTGMAITQENGQRRYGPLWESDVFPLPVRGSEVFVGKLPRNCFEPELVPVLERVGRIYEIRLMMNFSGNNRGYCFVKYTNPVEAERAVVELNNFEIRKGWRIGVARSVDNRRLFIGKIPKDKDAEAIKKELDKLVEGIEEVIVRQPHGSLEGEKNRGFAFVEFTSHKAAALAKRRLMLGKMKMWEIDVAVDWADPEPESQDLIVRNLPAYTNEETLRAIFNAASFNGVVRIRKIHDRAYISFSSHCQALMAKASLVNQIIDGGKIQIEFDKSTAASPVKHSTKGKFRIEFNKKLTPAEPRSKQYMLEHNGFAFQRGNPACIMGAFPNTVANNFMWGEPFYMY